MVLLITVTASRLLLLMIMLFYDITVVVVANAIVALHVSVHSEKFQGNVVY